MSIAALGPLVTVELLAGAAILGRELLWPADPAAAHMVLRHRLRVDAAALAEVTGFAQIVADLQRHAALTASRQAQSLGDDVEAALARLVSVRRAGQTLTEPPIWHSVDLALIRVGDVDRRRESSGEDVGGHRNCASAHTSEICTLTARQSAP